MACNSKCSSRQEAIYLLKELGFDTTILQGSELREQRALDDSAVVRSLHNQMHEIVKMHAILRALKAAHATVDTDTTKQLNYGMFDNALMSKQRP